MPPRLGVADGDAVTLGNVRGETTLTARLFDGVRRGVLIAESIFPNRAHAGGRGINVLTSADSIAPHGGAAFHDNKVWARKACTATREARLISRMPSMPEIRPIGSRLIASRGGDLPALSADGRGRYRA